MNEQYLRRLRTEVYAIADCPALDAYGSTLFNRRFRETWKLLRSFIDEAIPGFDWGWNSYRGSTQYPEAVDVPSYAEFVTVMLHEAGHGWCLFLRGEPSTTPFPDGLDEEFVCWEVSRLACEALSILYHQESADLSQQFYRLMEAQDFEGIEKINSRLPAHLAMSDRPAA